MHVLKKDYENLNRIGKKKTKKKNMYFIMKTLLIKKKKKNALTGINIEPSLYVCGIAHCT